MANKLLPYEFEILSSHVDIIANDIEGLPKLLEKGNERLIFNALENIQVNALKIRDEARDIAKRFSI